MNIEAIKHFGHYSVTGSVMLPLTVGDRVINFTHDGFRFPKGRYSALYIGNIRDSDNLLTRLSSNCQWAFYFGSTLCDCKWQMEESKRRLAEEGNGLIVFAHDQNGKGVPIEDHWMVYAEGQMRGLEVVVDAYEQLGFREDYREYDDVADILHHYGIRSVRLLTNSPNRVKFFEDKGIRITIEGLGQPINVHLKPEYRSKKHRLGHLLKVSDDELR